MNFRKVGIFGFFAIIASATSHVNLAAGVEVQTQPTAYTSIPDTITGTATSINVLTDIPDADLSITWPQIKKFVIVTEENLFDSKFSEIQSLCQTEIEQAAEKNGKCVAKRKDSYYHPSLGTCFTCPESCPADDNFCDEKCRIYQLRLDRDKIIDELEKKRLKAEVKLQSQLQDLQQSQEEIQALKYGLIGVAAGCVVLLLCAVIWVNSAHSKLRLQIERNAHQQPDGDRHPNGAQDEDPLIVP